MVAPVIVVVDEARNLGFEIIQAGAAFFSSGELLITFKTSEVATGLLSSEPSSWRLRHQFVAACFSNQDSRGGGILLHLLP